MSYKKIGDYIQLVDVRNKDLKVTNLLGLTINKKFIPSVANIVGADMANYKIIKKNQFACSIMQVRRDKKMPVALLKEYDESIISQAYPIFEITDKSKLLPDYLMLWFSRSEFDREACFNAVGGVRGSLEWEDFCEMKVPIPSIEIQKEIVKEYNVVQNRIDINNKLITKLEETAQAIYKHWFVDNIDLENLPDGWRLGTISDVLLKKGYIRGPFGSSLKLSDMKSIGIPVYEQQHAINNHRNFRYFISEEKSNSLKRFIVQTNDFVVSCSGTLGKIIEIKEEDEKGVINQALLILRVNEKVLHPKIFKYFITSSKGNSLLIEDAKGSAQVNIAKKEEIVSIQIVIPDSKTQILLSKKFLKIDKMLKLKTKENQKLEELQEILLSRLSGGLG